MNTQSIFFAQKICYFLKKITSVRLMTRQILCGIGLMVCHLSALAHNYPHKPTQVAYTITVSQYELALAQVLFEICPSMLNKEQQLNFYQAYQNQLRVFIHTSGDPTDTMRHIANQKNYQAILQNIRIWTASFPPQENQKLCQEFARKTGTF